MYLIWWGENQDIRLWNMELKLLLCLFLNTHVLVRVAIKNVWFAQYKILQALHVLLEMMYVYLFLIVVFTWKSILLVFINLCAVCHHNCVLIKIKSNNNSLISFKPPFLCLYDLLWLYITCLYASYEQSCLYQHNNG